MRDATFACRVDSRRQRLFDNTDWNGLDYLDVADDQMSLCVHFFGGIPDGLSPDTVCVTGGRRIRNIRVLRVAPDPSHDEELDDCLRVTLDRAGDFSTYRLCLVDVAGIDPRFACLDFRFKTNCPSDRDCGDTAACPPAPRTEPAIDYLAKDYASFRRILYDRLALILPDWRERHVADLGATLVELLAYTGDYLSYYQDAVATEAYLDTARQRVSVRRHLRLIDYALHEGCNARAFVTVDTDVDFTIASPRDAVFATTSDRIEPYGGSFVAPDVFAKSARDTLVFEPLGVEGEIEFRAAHSRIAFHDWGDGECCLPAGATSATLVDPAVLGKAAQDDGEGERRLALSPGDYLILEEVRGPLTGNPVDADPAHRHVVRLTRVSANRDVLLGVLLVDVEWAPEDALPFPLCISARRPAPDCDAVRDVSVARGNVVPVDHGATDTQPLDPVAGTDDPGDCACEGSIIEVRRTALPYAPTLDSSPLTFAEPVSPDASAAALTVRDPRAALPAIVLDDAVSTWLPRHDLIASGGNDRHFVAEIDDAGSAHLRFGDDVHGRAPDVGSALIATYRSGGGTAGNVGREAIGLLALRSGILEGVTITVRNPIAAGGGVDPEPVAEGRLFGPGIIRARRERAIVAEDYAELAVRETPLQGAAATLHWTGSWYEARVAIDPLHHADADPTLLVQVTDTLARYRRIGHDLAVTAAGIVPLRLAMRVCVLPHYDRAHIERALRDVFASRLRADGTPGFFHPDAWRFGQHVALSQIVAAAMAVEGIETVRVTALHRLDQPGDTSAFDTGRLVIRPGEIARLDNDPDFPEHGLLDVDMGGGR